MASVNCLFVCLRATRTEALIIGSLVIRIHKYECICVAIEESILVCYLMRIFKFPFVLK